VSDLPARPPLYVSPWLTLDQAKDRLMARGSSAEEAETQITDIVRDGMAGDGPRIHVNGNPPGRSWRTILHYHPEAIWGGDPVIKINREDLDRLLGPATTWPPAPGAITEKQEDTIPIFAGTGCAGRPSKSWHLIEPELRRRYDAGERYPNDKTGMESPTKWAAVLIPWLTLAHPSAPVPKQETLENNVRKALRELTQQPGDP
jgi:hypothetical protein